MTAEALRRHFEAVADASPIPVLLYSVPAFTGLAWPAGLAAALAAHPRIAGMKESSGDLGLLGRIVAVGAAALRGGLRLRRPSSIPRSAWAPSAGILAVACCAPAPARRRSTAPSSRATTRARAGCRTR